MKPSSNSSRQAKISAFVSKGKENMLCAAGCALGVFFTVRWARETRASRRAPGARGCWPSLAQKHTARNLSVGPVQNVSNERAAQN